MNTKRLALGLALLALGASVAFGGEGGNIRAFVFLNNTGANVTVISIAPCSQRYPHSGAAPHVIDSRDFRVRNGEMSDLVVFYQTAGYEYFDIEVRAGSRRLLTRGHVGIPAASGDYVPLLNFARPGANRDVLIAGGASIVAVGAIGGHAIRIHHGNPDGVTRITSWLRSVGRGVPGPGKPMSKGIAVLVAVPVAAGAIAWGISSLMRGELVATEVGMLALTSY